tara:strand:+ start:1135 stop:1389 length:255 start_codon:yes stop_codon:yes gene_type:complete
MKKMYNVVQGQKRRSDPEKSDWVKLGIAFEDSKGMRIKLNALPIPNQEAEIWLSLFPMDDKGKVDNQPSQQNNSSGDLNDEIPF